MSRLFALLLAASACLALTDLATAQDKSKTTYTDPAQADADFAFQGEFAGGGWGLQVVAGGGAKFDAVLYPGGLLGNGWNRREPAKLKGELENDVVSLKSDHRAVRVYRSHADVLDAYGRIVARLTKISRISRTIGQRPPPGAVVLFNGTSIDQFQNAKMTDDGLLRIGTMTKDKVGDFRLHLEFRTPYMPYARGQGRANSGVYIQQRYEVQILDSFGLEGIDNECAALYKQKRPDVNMALPPLAWQTYDIWFRQPRWSADGKTRLEPARITVLHNGVAVHWNYAVVNKTGGGKPEGPEEFPIALQDHGNPVMFRNIWMVEEQGVYPTQRVATQVCCASHRLRLFRRCR